ncbi:response regulator [Treponema sp.]|uniref:response regulator n=1 Tax=Treponema sp. TaxID=166 RepID=UPI00298DCF8F|nr:response regulator [Treponema sp.]MCI6443015.1 response regulator [Spirochaetia bacterium]MDY4133184.1 response regulator [Treponema sp.]
MSKKSDEKSVVYSALEVARICGVVNQTSINWIKNGHLKAFKTPGGQFRVYPDDLVEFMKMRDMRIPEEVVAQCKNNSKETKKIKILFVDDDESFNNVSVSLLQKSLPDAEIYQAYDGFEAGSMAVKKMPDCLILDLSLPGVDGIKICRTISTSDAFGKPQIIIVTAMEDEETEKTCRDLGVKYYFRKPVFIPELVTAVKELMSVE